MLATLASTATHTRRAIRRNHARRPELTILLTAGERSFLRAVRDRPAARYDDLVMLQNGRLVALLGRPRIAVKLTEAGLSLTTFPDLDDPDAEGVASLTRDGRRALMTGRRSANPA
jgi:hypothetical protein